MILLLLVHESDSGVISSCLKKFKGVSKYLANPQFSTYDQELGPVTPMWVVAAAALTKTRAWRYFILFFFIILVFQFFPCAPWCRGAEQFAAIQLPLPTCTRAPVLIYRCLLNSTHMYALLCSARFPKPPNPNPSPSGPVSAKFQLSVVFQKTCDRHISPPVTLYL